MSNVCAVCGKHPVAGNNVSHSNRRTKRVFKPNIVKTKVEIDGKVKNLNICTRCLKAGKVTKVI